MVWGKIEFEENLPELLTSDRPVVRTDALGANNAHIVFPIGPRRLFFAAQTQSVADKIQKIDRTTLLREINLRVVQQASKFVYARRDKPLRFVEKHMSTKQRPRLFELLQRESSRSHIDEYK